MKQTLFAAALFLSLLTTQTASAFVSHVCDIAHTGYTVVLESKWPVRYNYRLSLFENGTLVLSEPVREELLIIPGSNFNGEQMGFSYRAFDESHFSSPFISGPCVKTMAKQFRCTDKNKHLVYEGVIPSIPALGQQQTGAFWINDVFTEAQYSNHSTCFTSRAGEQICGEPDEFRFQIETAPQVQGVPNRVLVGQIDQRDHSYLNIRPFSIAPDVWHSSAECDWITPRD